MDGGIDNIKYKTDHEDWIAANDTNGKVRFNSNGKFWRATGYDMQIKWHPLASTSFALAYANVRLDAIRINKSYRPPEPQKDDVPEHTASLFITQRFGAGWSASLLSYHQSFTNWRGGTKTDSYYRHDIALSKLMTVNGYQFRWDAKVENLTDEVYIEYQVGNYYERAAYLSMSMVW
jgi:outer membrane receptor protein involved in Fe transport